MIWVVVFVAASALLGGVASYTSRQPLVPQLQHRPGTPIAAVESCRQAVITTAQQHASELGAELVRVDATSAGPMRQGRGLQSAPVEVAIVYSRPQGQEVRQGVIECQLDRTGRATLANLEVAAR